MKKTTAAITLAGSFLVLALFATAYGSGYGSGYYERGSRYYGANIYGYPDAYRGTYYNDDGRYGYRGSRYEYRGVYGAPGAYGAPYYNNNRYEYRDYNNNNRYEYRGYSY